MEKYAHLASFKELAENDFNLNIPRYVDTFEEEVEINIKTVQNEIENLEGELANVRYKMETLLKEMQAMNRTPVNYGNVASIGVRKRSP